jgi:hypothetical protein
VTMLPPMIAAKVRGDLVELTRLTVRQLDDELRGQCSRVWISLHVYTPEPGFRVAVLRRDSSGCIHPAGTLKVALAKPSKRISFVECDVADLDLMRSYSKLTGSPARNVGFELKPSSWFQALLWNRTALRHLRAQLLSILRQLLNGRSR